jgi:hypothetical protein
LAGILIVSEGIFSITSCISSGWWLLAQEAKKTKANIFQAALIRHQK